MKRREKQGQKPKDESGPQFIGYAGVSTREQNLDLQLDALARLKCLHVYTEKTSGASKRRPELDKAIATLREGNTFVVWRLDRVARNMRQLYERLDAIHERGAQFKSLTEGFDLTTAGGKFLLHVLAAVAEFERQLTIERTMAGVAARQARGLPHGRPVKFDNAKRKKAMTMVKRGVSDAKIADRLDVSYATIHTWRKSGMKLR